MIENGRNRYFGVTLVVAIIFSMVGCSLFEHNPDRIPTTPNTQMPIEQFGNFTGRSGVSHNLMVETVTNTEFRVNIPTPGDYLLTYNMAGIGDYIIALRVHASSLITIGTPARVQQVFIQKGYIGENFRAVTHSGSAELFNWPTHPWEHLFTASGAKISLPLPKATQSPRTGATVIVAVGDSITYGKGSTQGGYVPALEQKLRAAGYDVSVQKKAVPGERAASTVKRFDSAITGADIVLIMIGTNDLVSNYNCPAPYFCNASGHVRTMVDKALQAGVQPFVSMIPPIRTSCEGFWSNYSTRQLNAQYVAVAESRYVPLVDNYYPILYNGGDALFVDCLHFNDWGYNVIADQFFNALLTHNVLRK